MATPRFHCPLPLESGSTLALPDDTFHHAVRVRRLRIGDPLVLFAGDGREASATLTAIRRDAADVRIDDVIERDCESPLAITLLQGISSGDRMDYTLQKAVELGVGAIVPIAMQRSVRVGGERSDKRVAHWRQIVISACEQSGRNRVPHVATVVALDDALASAPPGCRLLLSAGGNVRLRDVALPPGTITLLAGPEGGMTADEEQSALAHGFVAITLGPRILRTETAAVAALAAIEALWGDG